MAQQGFTALRTSGASVKSLRTEENPRFLLTCFFISACCSGCSFRTRAMRSAAILRTRRELASRKPRPVHPAHPDHPGVHPGPNPRQDRLPAWPRNDCHQPPDLRALFEGRGGGRRRDCRNDRGASSDADRLYRRRPADVLRPDTGPVPSAQSNVDPGWGWRGQCAVLQVPQARLRARLAALEAGMAGEFGRPPGPVGAPNAVSRPRKASNPVVANY